MPGDALAGPLRSSYRGRSIALCASLIHGPGGPVRFPRPCGGRKRTSPSGPCPGRRSFCVRKCVSHTILSDSVDKSCIAITAVSYCWFGRRPVILSDLSGVGRKSELCLINRFCRKNRVCKVEKENRLASCQPVALLRRSLASWLWPSLSLPAAVSPNRLNVLSGVDQGNENRREAHL
jgi:hypothetical protein